MKTTHATIALLLAAHVAANRASADAPAPSLVAVAADQADVDAALRTLSGIIPVPHPAGRTVDAAHAAQLGKLGLATGDLVRAIDGEPAVGLLDDPEVALRPFVYLDVVRAGKPVAVRVAVRFPAKLAGTFDGDKEFYDHDLAFHISPDASAKIVMVVKAMGPLRIGDAISLVDGKPATRELLEAALGGAKHHTTVLTLARGDSTVAFTLDVTPAVELDAVIATSIKKVDDTHYTVDKTLVDTILSNPMAVSKGARVVPSVKDGKPNGFKLYAIRPNSLFAKLGWENGDTLTTINGMDLTSADKALEVYTKIREAKQFVVALTRRGKPITITYTLK